MTVPSDPGPYDQPGQAGQPVPPPPPPPAWGASQPDAPPPPASGGSYASGPAGAAYPGPSYSGPPPAAPGWGQPQAGPTQEERTWAWISHAGCFIGAWLAMAFLVPLVIMLVQGNDSAFVRRHAVESLNFQITALIYLAISVVLAFVLIGFILLPVLGLFWLVVVIMGTVKAANGQEFRYPLTLRLVS